MSETVTAHVPLQRWQGERATYHLVILSGEAARTLDERALLDRLAFGRRRGFGSIRVTARIGETQWKTSVFPQRTSAPGGADKEYVLLIGRKVITAERLAVDQMIEVELAL